MSQQRDDTTNGREPTPGERARGGYYYDDTTGYELYDPTQDKEDDEDGGEQPVAPPAR